MKKRKKELRQKGGGKGKPGCFGGHVAGRVECTVFVIAQEGADIVQADDQRDRYGPSIEQWKM